MNLYGTVISVSAKGHGYIRESDGTTFLGLSSNVAEDEVGRRYFVLNEEVTFEYMANTKHPCSHPLAINIKPIGREVVDVENHQETVTLESWDGTKGTARRPNTHSDHLWVRVGDIITEGIETVRVGSQLYCKVSKPNKPGQRWQAREVEVFMEHADVAVPSHQ